jgi:hypothetical protein
MKLNWKRELFNMGLFWFGIALGYWWGYSSGMLDMKKIWMNWIATYRF